jgi:hypothetical protein
MHTLARVALASTLPAGSMFFGKAPTAPEAARRLEPLTHRFNTHSAWDALSAHR